MADTASSSSLSFSSSSSRRHEAAPAVEGLTDPEMAAAQQLMQLSGDELEESDWKGKNKRDPDGEGEEEEEEEKEEDELELNQSEITSAKIEEIFGRDDEEEEEKTQQVRPRKRRYRSLLHIYMTTKPVNVVKKMKVMRC